MLSGKWRTFCLGLKVLKGLIHFFFHSLWSVGSFDTVCAELTYMPTRKILRVWLSFIINAMAADGKTMQGTRASTGYWWPDNARDQGINSRWWPENVRNQGINGLLMARKCKEPGHQRAADDQTMPGTRASTGCWWPDNVRNQGINRLLMARQCKEPGHQQATDWQAM